MSELAKNLSTTALMLVVETLAAKELYDINRTTENFEFLCEKRGKLETYIAELERDFDMLFRSSANKQPRKNTQTLTFEYGMESEE